MNPKDTLIMCTDCDVAHRPDITLFWDAWGDDHVITAHSAAANAFLARKFAQVEGDLAWADINRIATQAQALGFNVERR